MLRILLLVIVALTIGQSAWMDWPHRLMVTTPNAELSLEYLISQAPRLALLALGMLLFIAGLITKKASRAFVIQANGYFDLQLLLLALDFFQGRLALGAPLLTGLNWFLELIGFSVALGLYWHLSHGWTKRQPASGPIFLTLSAILAAMLVSVAGQWLSWPGMLPAWPETYPLTGAFSWPSVQDWLGGALDITPVADLFTLQQIVWLGADLLLLGLTLHVLLQRRNPALRANGLILLVAWLAQLGVGLALITQQQFDWLSAWLQYSVFLLLPPLLGIFKHSCYQRRQRITETQSQVTAPPTEPIDLYARLKTRLGKTRTGLIGWLSDFSAEQNTLDSVLERVENQLLMADIGIATTTDILERLKQRLADQTTIDSALLKQLLQQELAALLRPLSQPLIISQTHKPFVILVVGVNGAGKTTTIGKLAKRLSNQGLKVMLAAGDTFRAAAVEQLQVWGERNQVPVIAQQTGADSASVIFDALQSARNKAIDVLIADTAGRLHTKSNLMEELKKVKRIMAKLDPQAPHEVLLVLDAGIGQNGLAQARQFHDSMGVTGLALTKLDGTAKGGVIFALAKQLHLPIRLIGVGEGVDDLQDFDAEAFIAALFNQDH